MNIEMNVNDNTEEEIELVDEPSTPTENDVLDNLSDVTDLDENIHYSAYAMDDVDKYAEHLPELNYIELVRLKKTVNDNLKSTEEIKGLMDSLNSMDLPDDMNRKMMQCNVLKHEGVDSDVDQFMDEYPQMVAQMNYLLEKIDAELEKYGDETKGTKFFTEQMILLMEKNISLLSTDNPNYELAKKKLETVKQAFENRLDAEYLSNYAKTVVSNKRTMRRFTDGFKELGRSTPGYEKDLLKSFSKTHIQNLRKFLSDIDRVSHYDVELILFILSRVVKNEINSGKDVYAKIFVLNIMDCMTNTYDYSSHDEFVAYLNQILSAAL